MKFTYFGHSCFLIEIDSYKILFDPFIKHNELAKDVNINEIEADFILISHGHIDHIADAVQIAQHTKAKVISNWEICEWLQKQGITNCHPMNTGGKFTFEFGTVKTTVAQHSSGLPDGSYGGNPMGFIIKGKSKTIYYSGDTALTLDMQLIPKYSKLDIAVMPIGDNFTMGYEDAIQAAQFIDCKNIIGVHFDTFGYIKIDHNNVSKAFKDEGLNLILPEIKNSYNF
jgi:L-ascorbate metabolism protein UlaG (beta-lactamase superfamily)